MSDLLNSLLDRAAAAFARREEDAALEVLLEAWRESPEEAIAEVIQRLSDRLEVGLTPLHIDEWRYYFARLHVMDPPRLLAGLVQDAKVTLPDAIESALVALQAWPRDPRMLPALVAIARLPVAEDAQVMRHLCLALERVGALYDVEPLLERQADFVARPVMATWLDRAIQFGRARVPARDADVMERCAIILDAIEQRTEAEQRDASTRELLLARLRSAPGDEESLRVYADLLLSVGDPLGEFIALQSSSRPDAALVSRLLEANRVRWEGSLGPGIERGRTRFARGFPVSVQLRSTGARHGIAEPGPAWLTVEELSWNEGKVWGHWGADDEEDWGAWLQHPHLQRVTRHVEVPPGIARLLANQPLPIQHLHLSASREPRGSELFDALANLPRLSRLDMAQATALEVAACARSLLAPRLEHFDASHKGEWWLTVKPRSELPVQATLVSPSGARNLAEVLRPAAELGARTLCIRGTGQLSTFAMGHLREAAAAYARVLWE